MLRIEIKPIKSRDRKEENRPVNPGEIKIPFRIHFVLHVREQLNSTLQTSYVKFCWPTYPHKVQNALEETKQPS